MRRWIAEHAHIDDDGFRWRGHEVSRIEGFSDAVFAFALTLLVVALEVPKTYEQLLDSLFGFFAFAACFAILYQLWLSHYIYFRRYGLSDTFVLGWNAVLLFLVLFFIYPVKFIFTALFAQLFVHFGVGPAPIREHMRASFEAAFKDADGAMLMVIYGGGYMLVSLVFALLYRHALTRSKELQLDALEIHLTREEIQGQLLMAAVAVASIVLAVGVPGPSGPMIAGFTYFAIGPLRWWHGARFAQTRPKRGTLP